MTIMFKLLLFALLFIIITNADLGAKRKDVTLKPLSACCDIPELGDPTPLSECSNPKPTGPCNDIQCAFEKSGFLKNKDTLDKEAYKRHLRLWAEKHEGWTIAVNRAIEDCVDKDLRQYLDIPCKAYDVFTCTGISLLKKCPTQAWKC
ncbi:uncharacterized protein LOC128671671 [Plodia interpunctella]|uniref:uncharacterized protein LOC128671671 n=1 Tax=Plodia interpunctella TaxID=58824 RepID=UPI002367EB9E|nr:uncharacterized protein LOC128671671 [Plodia interpunctella]